MSQSDSSPAPASPRPGFLEPQNNLVRLGGALGIAAACIGLLIFLGGCAGFDAAFKGFPLIPLILGVVGLTLSLCGAAWRRFGPVENSRVLAAFFVNVLGIVGAILELAVWLGWATLWSARS